MAHEPLTLLSLNIAPALVAQRLRELAPAVEIEGSDDSWKRMVVTITSGDTTRTLTLLHDPNDYREPHWSRVVQAMRQYFERFPDSPRKSRALQLASQLRFSLSPVFEPDLAPAGDRRLDLLLEVTGLVGGVLFTPSTLYDAGGRVLFSVGGATAEDPDAEWPELEQSIAADATPLAATLLAITSAMPPLGESVAAMHPSDPTAPSAQRVARRALALSAVTARAILEEDADDPQNVEMHAELLSWVAEIGVEAELEPDERVMLQQPLGQLDPESKTHSSWRLEGLAVLAWALGRYDIPAHDGLVDLSTLWDALGLLRYDTANALLAEPWLRSRAEIDALYQRLYALYSRLRDFETHPEPVDFAAYAHTRGCKPWELGTLPLVEGDLSVNGHRIDRASEEALATVQTAVFERHQAAQWLRSGQELYA
jgi:hypothetical protein